MPAKGQRYTIQETRTFSAADPVGQWYSYVTYQVAGGVWRDQLPRVYFSVLP